MSVNLLVCITKMKSTIVLIGLVFFLISYECFVSAKHSSESSDSSESSKSSKSSESSKSSKSSESSDSEDRERYNDYCRYHRDRCRYKQTRDHEDSNEDSSHRDKECSVGERYISGRCVVINDGRRSGKTPKDDPPFIIPVNQQTVESMCANGEMFINGRCVSLNDVNVKYHQSEP